VNTSGIKIDELMRAIREEVRQKRAGMAQANVGTSSVDAVVHGQNAVIDEALAKADSVQAVGENLPPMTRQSGARRLLARVIARGFLRTAQMITRDQREFNSSLLVAVRAMADGVRRLQESVTVAERPELGIAVIGQNLTELQSELRSRVEALEKNLAEIQLGVTNRLETLEKELDEVRAGLTSRVDAWEARLAEVQQRLTEKTNAAEGKVVEATRTLEKLASDVNRLKTGAHVFDDATKPGHLVLSKDEKPESTATKISYAQNHEDILLARIFSERRNGFYIDIGAHDPVNYSVTKYFYDLGWHGINIEPSSDIFPRLCAGRARDINLNIGLCDKEGILEFYEAKNGEGLSTFVRSEKERHSKAGFEFVDRQCQVTTLASICERYVHCEIDFMSVDVEGCEREVIAGADWKKWRPRVVVIEATKPGTRIPSHEAWESLLLEADYLFATFDGLNRYYVRAEDKQLLSGLSTPVNVFDAYIPYEYLRQMDELRARIAAYERT
jgi:FkbM family methyltransferase